MKNVEQIEIALAATQQLSDHWADKGNARKAVVMAMVSTVFAWVLNDPNGKIIDELISGMQEFDDFRPTVDWDKFKEWNNSYNEEDDEEGEDKQGLFN